MELLALTGAAVQPLLLDSGSDTELAVQDMEDGELLGSTHVQLNGVFCFASPGTKHPSPNPELF